MISISCTGACTGRVYACLCMTQDSLTIHIKNEAAVLTVARCFFRDEIKTASTRRAPGIVFADHYCNVIVYGAEWLH